MEQQKPHKHVGPPRTYVRREGRLTEAQRHALETHLDKYSWPDELTQPTEVFGRQAKLIIEIGFGNGENLAEQAAKHRDCDYIGLEVHRPGVGSLLQAAEASELTNLRVSSYDATKFLAEKLPPASADVIQIFFPDPWPKKRHHKRRMVRADIMDRIAEALRPGGDLLLATDWDDYAEQMMEVLSAHPQFENQMPDGGYAPRADRVLTRFEKRAHRLGHSIYDFAFKRV